MHGREERRGSGISRDIERGGKRRRRGRTDEQMDGWVEEEEEEEDHDDDSLTGQLLRFLVLYPRFVHFLAS